MMSFSDALTLALTKFRIRKWRAITSALLAALVASAVTMGIFAYTGVKNSISSAVPSGFENQNLAVVQVSETKEVTFDLDGSKETFLETRPIDGFDDSRFEELARDWNVVGSSKVYVGGTLNLLTKDSLDGASCNHSHDEGFYGSGEFVNVSIVTPGDPVGNTSLEETTGTEANCVYFSAREDRAIEGYIDKSIDYGDMIPIVVSYSFAEEVSPYGPAAEGSSDQQRLERVREVEEDALGSVHTFYYGSDQDATELLPVQLVIVGIIPEQSSLLELAGLYSLMDAGTDVHIPLSYIEGTAFDGYVQDNLEKASSFFRVVEFEEPRDLRSFVKANCSFSAYNCGDDDVILVADTYNNYRIPFEVTAQKSWKFTRYVVLFFVFMSAASIYGTTSKVIADSRRETAVFRAIGATRLQITQIYMIYTAIISILAYILSIVLALLFNGYLTRKFDGIFEVEMAIATGTELADQSFSFIGFNLTLMVFTLLGTLFMGWLGAAIPVMMSLRRDPIKHLRDE